MAAAEEPHAFHTVEDVAQALHISTKTVRRRIKEGAIRKVPLGGRLVRISSGELRRLATAAPSGPPDQDCHSINALENIMTRVVK